jgi:hypothetical protein
MTQGINFVRIICEDEHITAVSYADVDVEPQHCAVCGSEDVEQIESQTIDADIKGSNDHISST